MKPVLVLGVMLVIAGCSSTPPDNPDNVCEIFRDKGGWYKDARASRRKWGGSIPLMMSFIYQESRFQAKARPPRNKILWIIPGPRPASAFGYAQATDETWAVYKKVTGGWGADRNNFGDAIDFVGWYNDQSYRKNGIEKTDAYNLYLAYHEGHGGFSAKSYRRKAWLLDVSTRVASRAATYSSQLKSCEKSLNRGRFFGLF